MIEFLDLTIEQAKESLSDAGFPRYKASQILDWVYKKEVYRFKDMTNISKKDAKLLEEMFAISLPKVALEQKSKDGTGKYLMELADGNMVECVLMDYSYGTSICISSQAGCRMNCSFCASGKDGLERNLTPGEMTGQIISAGRHSGRKIARVVVMGTGEPFDNYSNFINFLELATSPEGLGIGQRRITVSTCGIVPAIYEFADYDSQVNLSISLHETLDEERSSIMPVNKKYPIAELMKACRYYIKKTNRRISFEYALIPGKNDSREDALRLVQLLKGMLCYVNIIPVNRIDGFDYRGNPTENTRMFYDILGNHDIHVTVRRELGGDIDAACGQLRRSHADKVRNRNQQGKGQGTE
jgi:23S rRNA (adenine2503-C2)-methyltransferase